MNFDDYEQLPTPSILTNMIAGGAAGILEHCVMYPMDSIKVIKTYRTMKFYFNSLSSNFTRKLVEILIILIEIFILDPNAESYTDHNKSYPFQYL